MKRRFLISLFVITLILPVLEACGRKGSPTPAPGQKQEYPRQYPTK